MDAAAADLYKRRLRRRTDHLENETSRASCGAPLLRIARRRQAQSHRTKAPGDARLLAAARRELRRAGRRAEPAERRRREAKARRVAAVRRRRLRSAGRRRLAARGEGIAGRARRVWGGGGGGGRATRRGLRRSRRLGRPGGGLPRHADNQRLRRRAGCEPGDLPGGDYTPVARERGERSLGGAHGRRRADARDVRRRRVRPPRVRV